MVYAIFGVRWKDFSPYQPIKPSIPRPGVANELGSGIDSASAPTVKPHQFSKTGLVQLMEL
jgi:hypothetical protein